jgi:hypothetical protein
MFRLRSTWRRTEYESIIYNYSHCFAILSYRKVYPNGYGYNSPHCTRRKYTSAFSLSFVLHPERSRRIFVRFLGGCMGFKNPHFIVVALYTSLLWIKSNPLSSLASKLRVQPRFARLDRDVSTSLNMTFHQVCSHILSYWASVAPSKYLFPLLFGYRCFDFGLWPSLNMTFHLVRSHISISWA